VEKFILWLTQPYHWRFNLGILLGFLLGVFSMLAALAFWFYVLPLIVRYIIY
jgi:hypothetical protein